MLEKYTMRESSTTFSPYKPCFSGLWKLRIPVAFLILWPLPLWAEEMPKVEAVLKAWRKRQEEIRSAHFTWTESRTLKAGAVMNRGMIGHRKPQKQAPLKDQGEAKGQDSQGGIIPDKDVTFSVTHKLALDGDKVRYECQGKTWEEGKPEPVDLDLISTFDGSTPKTFIKSLAYGNPRGWIDKSANNIDLRQVHLISFLRLYRPFHPELGDIKRDAIAVSNKRALIAGKHCFALQQAINPKKGSMLIFWVALQPDFPIMRMQSTAGGAIYTEHDFSYSVDTKYGEVLSGWKYIKSSSPGIMVQSSSAVVREYELNKPIDLKEFQLDFPSGTFVSDLTKRRGEAGEFYIVREDKSERAVSRSEVVSQTYDELLRKDAQERANRGWKRWWLVLGLSIGICYTIVLLRRQWKRNPRPC